MAAPVNSSGLLQVANDTTSETFSAGFTFTAGRHAIAQFVHFATGQTIASVTIGGTAAVRDVRASTSNNNAEIWRANNIAGGTNQVVVTYTGGTDNFVSGAVQEWAAGDALTFQSSTPNTATGTSDAPAVSTAVSATAPCIVYGVTVAITSIANNALSPPSGWTQTFVEQNSTAQEAGIGAWREESAAGVKTATFGMTSGQWAAAIAAYSITIGPSITAQPSGQTVNDGASVSFSVTASGGTAPLTYQWQNDSSGSFANISGATSSTYNAPAATFAAQGRRYRCVVTDAAAQSVTSSAAQLAVAYNLSGAGPRRRAIIGAFPIGSWGRRGVQSAGTSSVSSDLDAAYQIRASVSADLDATYQLRNAIQQDLDGTYQIRASVSADLDAAYVLRASVTNDLDAAYQIIVSATQVSSDLDAAYALRASVTSDLDAIYALRNAVTSDLDGAYSVRSGVSADLDGSYAVRQSVSSDLDALYAVRQSVSADLDSAYSIRNAITSDLDASYQIRSAVQSDLDAAYSLRALVSADLDAAYQIIAVAGTVSSDLDAAYQIRAAVSADLDASYQIRVAVQSDLDATYALRQGVTADADAAYMVRASVSSDLDASYALRNSVTSDLDAAYRLFNAVSADLDSAYQIRAAVSADLDAAYEISGRQTVFSDLDAVYAVAGATQNNYGGYVNPYNRATSRKRDRALQDKRNQDILDVVTALIASGMLERLSADGLTIHFRD